MKKDKKKQIKTETENQTVTKHFRCTPEESRLIDEKAKEEHKTLSRYLRDAALTRNQLKIPQKAQDVLEDLRANELKIGTNINQADRLCNTKGYVTRADYVELRGFLVKLMTQRRDIIHILEDMGGW